MTTEQALRELRSLPGAPEKLRAHVRALPERQPRAWTLPRLELRRVLLVAAPAVLAIGFGAAALNGLLASGGGRDDRAEQFAAAGGARERAVVTTNAPGTWTTAQDSAAAGATRAAVPVPRTQPLQDAKALPPSTTRLNRYQAWLRVQVERKEIANAATRAMEIARSYGGYVASVDMNTPEVKGRAFLVLRIPVARVEDAVLQLGKLGDVKAQRVRIEDLERQASVQEREIVRLTARVETLETTLRTRLLSAAERARLQFQLEEAKRRLAAFRTAHARTLREGRLATVSVTYFAPGAAVAKPDEPGRLERTVREAADFLVREISWLLYAVIVAGPIALLALVAVLAARALRRDSDRRLLEGA